MKIIKKYFFHIIFIFLLLFIIFTTYKDYGVSWDEKVFLNVGKYYTAKLLTVLQITTNLSAGTFAPTWFHMQGHGVFLDIIITFLSLFFPVFNFETYHLIHAILAIPIFIIIGIIVGQLTNRNIGFLAMVLLLLFPRFYGDIFNNPIDVPTAFFFAASILAFLMFTKSRQTFLQQVIFGIILGLSINQRLILIYLIPLNFLFLILFEFTKKKRRFLPLTFKLTAISLIALITMHLTHPYLIKHPITGLIDMLAFSKQYLWTASVLYNGVHILGSELPWHYLPVSMLITIPESILLLFAIGIMYLIRSLFDKKKNLDDKLIYAYLLLLITIPYTLNAILRPILYDVWRHFLFLTIPIIIIASFGIKALLELKNKALLIIVAVLVGLNLLFVAREMVVLHPYQYIYFNSLIGGLKGAYRQHETDYWGESYKEATQWFIKNVNDGKTIYKIKTEGDPLSSSYYFTKNMIWTGNPAEADYIFSFTRWNLHTQYPGKKVYVVKREGVPLLYIIKTTKRPM